MNAWERRRMEIVGTKIMYYKQCATPNNSLKTNNTAATATASGSSEQPSGKNESNQDDNTDESAAIGADVISESQSIDQQQDRAPISTNVSLDGTLQSHDTATTSGSTQNQSDHHTSTTGIGYVAPTDTNVPQSTLLNTSTAAIPSSTTSTNTPSSVIKPAKKDVHQFWEQTKEKFQKSIGEITIKATAATTSNTKTTSDPNNVDDPDADAPRGSIDLIKENVIVAAVPDHDKILTSVSPSPYGLSIMVKSETKWKVCFDTHGEQVKWLTILTEIIVRKSVQTYNQEIHRIWNISSGSSNIGDLNDSWNSANYGAGGVLSSASSGVAIPSLTNMEMFRPAPHEKDGMWNLDENYSYRNLLSDKNLSGDNNVNSDIDGDENANSEDTDPVEEQMRAMSLSVKTATDVSHSKTATDDSKTYVTIIEDLPPVLEGWILKGATSGPERYIKGDNLYFLMLVANVSIFLIYAYPMHWLIFPFFIIIMNCTVLLVVMEKDCKETTNNDDVKGKDHCKANRISVRSMFQNSTRLMQPSTSSKQIVTPKINTTSQESKETKIVNRQVSFDNFKKPIAGLTTKKISNATESRIVNGKELMCWSTLESHEHVYVRSHGYSKTKKKISAPSSLYEVTNVEIFESSMRVSEIATKVVLPECNFDDSDTERRWTSPDTFVVSLAIPTDEPYMTRPTEDGFGFTVTIYYRMREETRAILKRITEPGYNNETDSSENHIDVQKRIVNSVRLWEQWCQKAPTDEKWQARFKLVPNLLNAKEVGLPSYISKYCGKPVLIKRKGKTGFLSTHQDINAFEFDISLHVFPYLAKKALAYLKSTVFKKALVSLSYVIEGRADDELPELLIGDAVKLFYPDPEIAIDSNDFFAGTDDPKSIKVD